MKRLIEEYKATKAKIEDISNAKKRLTTEYNTQKDSDYNSTRKFLQEKFPSISIDVDFSCIEIHTKPIDFYFTIKDDMLKMESQKRNSFRCHPLDIISSLESRIDAIENKQTEGIEPVLFEGGYKPVEKESINYYELLKQDLIDKGEITQTIKNFMIKRQNLSKEFSKTMISFDQQLAELRSFNFSLNEKLKNINTEESFGECIKVFDSEFTIKLPIKKDLTPKTISFLYDKEKYIIESEEIIIKVNKEDFKLTDYIRFKNLN